MTNKILVTTDFSENSKAGLHFAIQLASQNHYELFFFHATQIQVPTAWSVLSMESFEKEQFKIFEKKLNEFVKEVYDGLNIPIQGINCIVENSVFAQSSIMEYAANNNFSYVCISTRGAGKAARLLGTTTGTLINHSDVPVIAIPDNYEMKPILSLLVASDLIDIRYEITEAVAFAEPLNAVVELLHLTAAFEHTADLQVIEAEVKASTPYPIHFNFIGRDPNVSLVHDIESAVKKMNPSLMIMFTNQNRSWFEKIFLSSKSAEYSFNAKVPLLVFKKV